ncbi:MAG: prepilin-type N-terminal cleavage/methylation domain-containing protein [Phycisphaerales bacterium]|nr:prepilin-type N-terminal cleavage/methylation domain-containing protein [Phycisphaerales bacterium]
MAHRQLERARRAGFTLMEMMVVVVIVIVVLAIVFPALQGARNAARKAGTQALLADLGKASSQFQLDHRRNPGYFAIAEMASDENMTAARGFTEMENIVIDLAGGITQSPVALGNGIPSDTSAQGPRIVEVGPTAANTVRIQLDKIGAPTDGGVQRSYWTPEAKLLQRQTRTQQKVTMNIGHRSLPDVVDPMGNPLLAWNEDTGAVNLNFGGTSYKPTSPQTRARFYWAPNSSLLSATQLGRRGASQAAPSSPADWPSVPHSVIGKGHENLCADAAAYPGSLSGLLGNPAFPNTTVDPPRPAASRGEVIFHSAGVDGIFLSSAEAGGKAAAAAAGPIPAWVLKYAPPANSLNGFDDVLGGGN